MVRACSGMKSRNGNDGGKKLRRANGPSPLLSVTEWAPRGATDASKSADTSTVNTAFKNALKRIIKLGPVATFPTKMRKMPSHATAKEGLPALKIGKLEENLSPAGGKNPEPGAAESGSGAGPGATFVSPFPSDIAFSWWREGAGAPPTLLPEERRLLGAGVSAKRTRDFTLGRHCAHQALERLQGISPAPENREAGIITAPPRLEKVNPATLPILRGAGRMPLWPEGVVGSITHSAGMAAAAAAYSNAYAGIGLDLERVGRSSERLIARILRPEERVWLEALPAHLREVVFAVIFSTKESIFKALHPATGVFLGFQEAALLEAPQPGAMEDAEGAEGTEGTEGSVRWRLFRSCGAPFPSGYTGQARFVCRGGYVLTAVWVEAAGV